MKDSEIEWIGEIPEDWEVVPTKRFYKNEKEIVGERESQFERLALTLNGVIKRSKDDGKGLQPAKFETYQILYKGELVFKLIDLENVRTSRVGYSNYTGLVSPVYVRLINSDESKFGYYYFINMWHQEIFNYLGSGVRSNLTAKDLLKVPYLEFTELEKKKIAQKLNTKTKYIKFLIEQTQQSIKELKKYKQSLITEAVTKGLDPNVEMKDSGIEWIGKIPSNWHISKIGRVSTLSSGGTPVSGNEDYYDGEIPWVRSLDLNEREIFTTDRNLSEEGLSVISGGIVKKGSIVIAMYGGAGTIGNSGILGIDASTNQAICSIELNESYDKRYYFYYIRFIRPYWMIYAVGTRKDPNISKQIVQKMPCIIPSISEQRQIVSYLDEQTSRIDKLIENKTKVIEELEDYKKSLIYEYVTGKKEV